MGEESFMESDVSSMSEVEHSTSEHTRVEGGEDGKSKIAVAAVAACILLLAVIGVLAFIGAESNVVEDTDTEDSGGGKDGHDASYVKPTSPPPPPATTNATVVPTPPSKTTPSTTPKSTTKLSTKSKTATTTPSTTPKSTTKLSTKSKTTMTTPSTTPKSTTKLSTKSVTTTTTPEPELKEVLCTVGHSAVTTNMYPPEFPCDYLYYTSVVILKKEVMATEVQTSWTTFKAMAKNYTRLISGMSFDYRYFSHQQLQPAIPTLNALAQARIGSYGILNIVASPEDLRTAVYKMRQGIQTLKRWQSTNPARRSVIALGSTDYSGENYTDTFKNLVKSVINDFKIDTVIAISSVGAIDTQAGCYSVPPTVFSSPMARFPSLSTHWELISLKMAYIKNATAGLSFEMGTMTYWLKAQASNFTGSFYQRCEYLTMTSRDAVCGTSPAQYQEGDYYIYGGFVANNSQQGVAFADYNMSGQKKWEKARRDGEAKGLKLRRRVAIMLFNVHLEDIDKKCSVAPFAVETRICEALKGAGKCQ